MINQKEDPNIKLYDDYFKQIYGKNYTSEEVEQFRGDVIAARKRGEAVDIAMGWNQNHEEIFP